MPIDIGDTPTGTPPTTGEKLQIRTAIGLGQTDAPTFLAASLTGQSLTGTQATSLVDLATTWLSTTGTPTAIKMNVIDTANVPTASLLMDLQVGGVSKFSVRKDGLVALTSINLGGGAYGGDANWFSVAGLNLSSSSYLSFGAADIRVYRDAAGILAQRNGTAAQAFRVYNTYTDASNYQRLSFGFASGVAQILSSGAGTSGHAALTLGTGTGTWQFTTAGNFIALADNTYDIGASGANRPRNIYVGGSLNVSNATIQASNGFVYINGTGESLGGSTSAIVSMNGTGIQLRAAATIPTVLLTNFAGTDFGRLQFGGITSAFPAIKRNGTGIHIVLADDSGFAPLSSGALTISGGGANITGIVNGTAFTSGFYVQTNTQFMFGTGGVGDVALQKNATGVVEINNTTAGTFRDLRCRSVIQQPPAGAGAITPALNGDLVVEATSNTLLTFKFKGSDGTVRSGTMVVA